VIPAKALVHGGHFGGETAAALGAIVFLPFWGGHDKKIQMLIADPYSLLPAFTIAAILAILLWPENIAFKYRLRLFILIILIWVVASLFGMEGYGTTEKPLVCFVNFVVGLFGLIALAFTYRIKPSRGDNHS